MRADVPPMHPDESLARAAELMPGAAVRALPVVVDGVAVGMVARQDLLRVLTGSAGR